jgi:membrane protease YdiL (CAAX protease family)
VKLERHSPSRKRNRPAASRRYLGAFPTASRKGRDRRATTDSRIQRAPATRMRDFFAGDGEAPAGNAKGKAPRSIQDLITTIDVRSVAIICVTACLSLLVVEFVGSDATYARLFPPNPHAPDPYWVLRVKAWWVLWIVISFAAIPAMVMACIPGKRLRDCNLSFRGFTEHFWIYIGLYLAVLPVIWIVSLTPDFYNFYPMYPSAGRSWSDLLMWEGLYIGQFVALEFFFRGFLVGGLSRHIGVLAVPVSVMPYMMLHFSKPWPEAAASVVAGFILGWLAWRLKSIWGGVCVHCAVAVSMDLLALSHKGQFPWPPQ